MRESQERERRVRKRGERGGKRESERRERE